MIIWSILVSLLLRNEGVEIGESEVKRIYCNVGDLFSFAFKNISFMIE